jgi:hypothetical protein
MAYGIFHELSMTCVGGCRGFESLRPDQNQFFGAEPLKPYPFSNQQLGYILYRSLPSIKKHIVEPSLRTSGITGITQIPVKNGDS